MGHSDRRYCLCTKGSNAPPQWTTTAVLSRMEWGIQTVATAFAREGSNAPPQWTTTAVLSRMEWGIQTVATAFARRGAALR